MDETGSPAVGDRVAIIGRDVEGVVSFVGDTSFAPGKWVGVTLDEPKGKNDGSVQGQSYFHCEKDYGLFIRPNQVSVIIPAAAVTSTRTPSKASTIKAATPKALGVPTTPGMPFKGSPKTGSIGNLSKTKTVPAISRSRESVRAPPVELSPSQPSQSDIMTMVSMELNTTTLAEEISSQTSTKPPEKLQVEPIPATAMSTNSGLIGQEVHSIQRLLTEKDSVITDLEEKLNTLKQKRLEDRESLKEFERMKIQMQQSLDSRAKSSESLKEVQAELRTTKREFKEALEKLERYNQEVQELQEAFELSALDKEMAEEKYETAVTENQDLRSQIEELKLELDVLRTERDIDGRDVVPLSLEAKQLEQQNSKMKEAIVRLKQISESDKAELMQLRKTLSELTSQHQDAVSSCQNLKSELKASEALVDELKERLELSSTSESLLDTLTEKNLALEDQLTELRETVADLETLRDLNQELEENRNQIEHDLREEVDIKTNKIRELEKKLDLSNDTIITCQDTIMKFRDLVAGLQERLNTLQEHQQAESAGGPEKKMEALEHPDAGIIQLQLNQVKQYSKVASGEVAKFEVSQAAEHVKMLLGYLPETFSVHGGTYDGIRLILLLRRLSFKANLLVDLIDDKYNLSSLAEKPEDTQGQMIDQVAFVGYWTSRLCAYSLTALDYHRAICQGDSVYLGKVSSQYMEISPQETIIDHLISLLCKDQLDYLVKMDQLDKAHQHLQLLSEVRTKPVLRVSRTVLANNVQMMGRYSVALVTSLNLFKSIAKHVPANCTIASLLENAETVHKEFRWILEKVRRESSKHSTCPNLPFKLIEELQQCVLAIKPLALALFHLSFRISRAAVSLQDNEYIDGQLLDMLATEVGSILEEGTTDLPASARRILYSAVKVLSDTLSELESVENRQQDYEDKQDLSYVEQAKIFRSGMFNQGSFEEKMNIKDTEIKELRLQIRVKNDEINQFNIRIGLLEKRSDNVTKEAEQRIEASSKRVENLQQELEKKSREYHTHMETLQEDITHLEKERSELRKKLDLLMKKTADPGRIAVPMGASGGVGASPKVNSLVELMKRFSPQTAGPELSNKESVIILAQMKRLRLAMEATVTENARLKAQLVEQVVLSLPPLPVTTFLNTPSEGPAKPVENRLAGLLKATRLLASTPKVPDLTKATGVASSRACRTDVLERKLMENGLRKQMEQISELVHKSMDSTATGLTCRTTFGTFLSNPFLKAAAEDKDGSILVARIILPRSSGPSCAKSAERRRVVLTPDQFSLLHRSMIA